MSYINQVNEWEAKKAMRASLASALQATNPHFVPGQTCAIAAKNIRIELKRAFPGIKFSVKSKSYSGGCSITVSWIDGPTSTQVGEITGKYKAGSFDGMTDCYNYEYSLWKDAFGDANYIFTDREYSDDFITEIIRNIAQESHDGELPTVNDFRKGKLLSICPSRHCDTWQDLIDRIGVQISKVAK